MQRNKLGLGTLLLATIAAVISSQANAQIFIFDFDNDSPFASGQGIGVSETVKADAFNLLKITTVDLFAPEFADDGAGIFEPTGNTLFASAGDGITTQTSGGFLGIDNPSVWDDDFYDGAGSESQDFNDGEGWVVEFDVDVKFESLSLASTGGGTLTITIDGVGSFDFADIGTASDEFVGLFPSQYIRAGTEITFAYSAPASAETASLRISSFTVVPGIVFDGVGDINVDGCIDFFDIAPFVAILASGGYDSNADLNFDGQVTFKDIAPFIAILASI